MSLKDIPSSDHVLHREGVRGLPHGAPAHLLHLAGEVGREAEINCPDMR